jgi:methylenetetrahydrofolate dehydrogenase (NADP+)/methenyltetrahydrofolate cyclohydrolase
VNATVIDGRSMADDLHAELAARIAASGRAAPGLATMSVGDDYAAGAYERRLRRIAESLGCYYVHENLPADVEVAEAVATVGKLNADPRISGILILRPLPAHIPEERLYRRLDPLKDIEAVHPWNAGLVALGEPRFIPSTPAAAFHLLDRYLDESDHDRAEFYERSTILFVGRSNNVGKPGLWLGLERNASVISCHRSCAVNGRLQRFAPQADVIIVAAGVAGLITGDHVKEGVIAVDIGINPVTDPDTGKVRLVGDLDYDSVAAKAEAITPVPGGVGPITDVWLLRNTVKASELPSWTGVPQSGTPGY